MSLLKKYNGLYDYISIANIYNIKMKYFTLILFKVSVRQEEYKKLRYFCSHVFYWKGENGMREELLNYVTEKEMSRFEDVLVDLDFAQMNSVISFLDDGMTLERAIDYVLNGNYEMYNDFIHSCNPDEEQSVYTFEGFERWLDNSRPIELAF